MTTLTSPRRRGADRLDCVVSNAAINPFMAWDETGVEDFNNLFETNVHGTWVVCTEGAKQMIRGARRRDLLHQLHLRALHPGAEPAELASAIACLLSDDASYVTSATLLVEGGFLMNAEL